MYIETIKYSFSEYIDKIGNDVSSISKSQAYYSWSQSPISLNARSILRTYAHDDVSVGSWMIGLDVKHVNEGKLCCSSWSSGLSLH